VTALGLYHRAEGSVKHLRELAKAHKCTGRLGGAWVGGVEWNGMNGLESLSREELIALAVELRQTVAEQGERIALLEAELERREKGADGTNAPHFVKASRESKNRKPRGKREHS